MSDEDILMRGGTEEDIALYAHDVGNACMYPDYPCEICEAREKAKKNIRVGRTYEDIINATDSIWIDGEKVEEAEIVKQTPQDEMLEEGE